MQLNARGRIVADEWRRLGQQFAYVELNAFIIMPNHIHGIIVIKSPEAKAPSVGATHHFPDQAPSSHEPSPDKIMTGNIGSPVPGEGNSSGRVGATHHFPDQAPSGHEPSPDEITNGNVGSPVPGEGDSSGRVGATHHLPDQAPSGQEPLPDEIMTGRVGSPLQYAHGPSNGSLGAIIGQFKSRATKRIWAKIDKGQTPLWQRNYYEHIIRNDADWQRVWDYIHNNPARWQEDQFHSSNRPDPINPRRR